jgi:hypothetical protein
LILKVFAQNKRNSLPQHGKSYCPDNQSRNAIATDRGFSSKKNETTLTGLGVKRCSLPRKGKRGQARTELENEHWFKGLQRYCAAGEAEINQIGSQAARMTTPGSFPRPFLHFNKIHCHKTLSFVVFLFEER